ncbi:TPA: TetR/AcrR family transcriptional regulator C-terminal domain-containing protein [Bacillus mobilis]|uniref:TetR/AcrR family transcriptional regulator C-terminal domain-containing protein n=4 Tax=Bacillaceae TaxID=186817 RepID=UPI000EA07D55|nr:MULTISPECIES: TetR/AcrR family transcriptional regulator C-terminal domain-containing protein [Bacillus]AYF05223.1 TetR family transcriptional regulator [Bacillus mobilis]BCD28044.1 TetR/AcrR family transcriptional regulator [Bacillus cereus]HDX9572126.1 TetR/AcrR family transcriptional regulator C-terminal domain-containing protein [Bacillus mobilis]
MEKIDRRIIKSQNAIQSAFIEMLITDGFDKITVKNITEKANIGRKTFYLHYLDKYNLLDKIVDDHLDQLKEICYKKQNKEFIEGTIIWFEYFKEHKSFFAALFKSNGTLSFQKKLLTFIMGEIEKKLNANTSVNKNIDTHIVLKFLGTAVMGILESYVLDEIDNDVEYVAMQVGELMKRNI